MSDPKPLRNSLRIDTLATALQQKLENEVGVLDLLVSALARGQTHEAMWEQLHDAALRDDRVAELAFAYERFSKDKKLRSLNPAAQTAFLLHAGSFFAEVFGDVDGAEPYLERAFSLSPGDAAVFQKLEAVFTGKGENIKLGEMYATAAGLQTARAEQLRMLQQAAVLMVGDEDRSAKIHLEVLKIDPTDVTSRRALEDCYERGGKLAELAKLLEQALSGDATSPDVDATKALRVRLISLYAGGLGEVERALPHVEELLRMDPAHPAARAIASELLSHKGVAARAAAALSSAFEASGEPGEAARMLGVEIDLLRGPKRLDAQKRLSALTFERLADPEKTFALDEAILPLDPADHEVRARFVKIASALDKQLEATKVLTRAATGAKDPIVRARINADLGDLLLELGDGRKARVAYQAALDARAEDPATLRAARALETICAEAKDHRALAAALGRLAEIESSDEARIAATLRLASLYEIDLRDAVGAIGAYRKLLGTREEPEALAALERLLEGSGAYVELCEVLDLRAGKALDRASAREISFRAAEIRSTKLPERAAALEAWKAWIEAHGATREALSRLIPLLETERRWEDLAAALVSEAATAPEGDRAGIFARLGQVRLARLGDARGALDAYREALTIDPTERTSRLALDKMLAAGELRLAAADVLEPLARAESAWTVLLRVLEARAALLDRVEDRLAALHEAALVAHRDLRDAKRAIEIAGRGLELSIEGAEADVPAWIERVEQVAGADAGRGAAVLRRVLGERAIVGPALSLLARRTGDALAASGDVAGALEVLRRALAADPSSHELHDRMDDLLREQGSPEERLSLHRAALERATEPGRRRALLHAIGAIERRNLGDLGAAVATYRLALAEDPGDVTAFAELLDLHEERGEWEALYVDLVGLLERTEGEDRVATERRLAEISVAQGWLSRAAQHYRALLGLDATLGDAALAAIEEVARAADDVDLVREVIERRVAATEEPRDVAAWLERLGDIEGGRLGRPEAAASAFARAAEASLRAGDAASAQRLHERVLAATPDDRASASALLALYGAAGAWERVPAAIAVLLRTAPDAEDAARTLLDHEDALLRAGAIDWLLAQIAEALSAERGAAISTGTRSALRSARVRILASDPARDAEVAAAYRAILEANEDEGDADAAAAAFEAFLAARGAASAADRRWLFRLRVAKADAASRVAILVAWAEAEEDTLGDPAAAAELYEQVIALDPEHDAALSARARILLGRGDAEGAVSLLLSRRDRAEGEARAAQDLAIATLLFDRLDRPAEALERVAAILDAGASGPAIALVTRLLARSETQASASALLERAALAAPDADARAALYELLLDTPADAPELAPARRGWFERLLEEPSIAPERALGIALRAVSEAPFDLETWERASQLAAPVGGADRVAAAYRKALGVGGEAKAPPIGVEGEVIEELGRRAVEYHEEWFDDQETVVALLRRTVDLAPLSTWAFERLKLTYNLGERWNELFSLYDDVIARTEDHATRRELLEDAALAAKDLAADTGRAMGYFEALLALRDDARIRTALERLYERHGRHRPLIALLARQIGGLSGEAAQKLRARIAGLWIDGLGEPASAVAILEEMLEAEPDRVEAFDLLERVLGASAGVAGPEATAARLAAAARLKGRYRAEGNVRDLARVLEVDLEGAATPTERAERQKALVRLRLDELGDEAGAFEGLAALLLLEPAVAEHREELSRLAVKLGKPERLAGALAAASALAEGDVRLDLLARAAQVYERDLGDVERAAALSQVILASAPVGHAAAVAAARDLDRLLAARLAAIGGGDAARDLVLQRCDVLETLATIEPEAPARRAARAELSRLAWVEAGDAERAIRAYRSALTEDPRDAEALDGLARALTAGQRWQELTEVLEQRAAGLEGDAARQDRAQAARIYDEQLGDPARAITAWTALRARHGEDPESADTLAALLEKTSRWSDLAALLEHEAAITEANSRGADLWVRVGDLHRERTGSLGESIAAYDLALSLRAGDAGAKHGLEDLVALLGSPANGGVAASEVPALLGPATALLGRIYAAADDWAGTIALLEPRLVAAAGDEARVAILVETAGLLERRGNDASAAFDAVFRALSITPTEALADGAIRLADAADRTDVLAAALSQGFDARPDVTPLVARALLWHVALWQRDRRLDLVAAEAALTRVLALDPDHLDVLEALAAVQRRSPDRTLIATLLTLATASGGDFDRWAEAAEIAEIAEGPVADRALATSITETLLAAATARWTEPRRAGSRFASAASAASWAIDVLVRLARADEGETGAKLAVDIYRRSALLPFDATERRRLRVAAAELAEAPARIAIYEELFTEDPSDPVAGERLDALYRGPERAADLVRLRERQIAVAPDADRRAALRFELAELLSASGDAAGAIAALRENLAETPAHEASSTRLAALLEAGGHHLDLVALSEEQAARIELEGDARAAATMWARAAQRAEEQLADVPRAIADHRRAAALGEGSSAGALARLLIASGNHEGAARVLEDICEQASPDALAALALRLTDAYLAANNPEAARARLERYLPRASEGEALRERLAALYRDAEAWEPLAQLIAESASRAGSIEARAALLCEAAAIHVDRRDDPAAAVPLLNEASTLTPDDGALRRRLASALIASGRLDEAAAALRVLIAGYGTRRPKERGLVHYELARVSLAAGDRAAAVSELDLALRIDPAQPEILHLQARLALEEGQLERAARTYRALLLVVKRPREERGPGGVSRAELLFELCEIAQLQGDPERSAEYLESAFETARETAPEAERLLAALRARKRHDVLARALEAKLATGPAGASAASLLEELAGLYDEHLGRASEAVDARLRALTVAPPTPARLDAARELSARAGATDRFVAVAAHLADREVDPSRAIELRLQIARALDTEPGDLAGAAEAYRAAEALLERDGDSPRLDATRAALARIHEARGDTVALAELLEKQIARAAEGSAAAEPLYRLAALRLADPSQHAAATELLFRALDADSQVDRAEALLRRGLEIAPTSAPVLAAFERVARDAGRERLLIEALVLLWERESVAGDSRRVDSGQIEEAVAIADRLGDRALVDSLLEKAIGRAESAGDAAFGWAIAMLADRRLEDGRLADAVALKERAARAADPERERALLLEAAGIAADALADLPTAARLLEELRSREPTEREIWQPLAEVYRRLGDRDRLAVLLDETAKILDSAAERAELRLERARMVMVDDELRAITLLEEIVEDDPTAIPAARLLTDLLEKHGRKEQLITVLGRRIDVAKDRQDVPVIVALSLRLGALMEQEWDEGGALDLYHAALDWDGKNRELLRAIVRIGMAREDSVALGSALDQLLLVEQGEPAAELALRLARIRAAHEDGEGAELALEQGFAACPGNAELREELIKRYESSEAWAKLAALHVGEADAQPAKAERIGSLCLAADILRSRAGDAAGAAAILARALDLDPSDRDVLLALIDAYSALGEHARAVHAVGVALAVTPDDAWLYRARASLHEALGDDRNALLDLEQAHWRSGGGYAGELVLLLEHAVAAPRSASAEDRAAERALRLRLAEVLSMAGETDRARAELHELTRTDGKDRGALRALAALEDKHGSWDAASAAYRRLLPLEDEEGLVAAALKLADACERGEHLGEARSALERALQAAPTDPAVRARLRDVYNVLGAGRELADLILEDAAASTDAAAKCGLLLHAGRLLLDGGEAPAHAAAVLEEARSLLAPQPPSAGPRAEEQEILLLLSDAYVLIGRVADAQTLLDIAVAAHKGRRSKQLAAVHRKRAQLELAVGDRTAALTALTRSFEGDPQNAALAMELGELAIELEDLELASRAYRGATLMKLAPAGSTEGVPVIARAHAYYQLARIAVAQGDRRKARLMIDKAVADDATHEGARYLLEQLRAG
jgi:tetratricopeptide (TPR) repeat protein